MVVSRFDPTALSPLLAGVAGIFGVPIVFWAGFRVADAWVRHRGWNLVAGFLLTLGFAVANVAILAAALPPAISASSR